MCEFCAVWLNACVFVGVMCEERERLGSKNIYDCVLCGKWL